MWGVRVPELLFKGKEFVHNHHLTVPVRPIVPHPERSIGAGGLDGNLVIQGDNLDALKALLPFYAGTVDCVFSDPPYNTGNEGWHYNDNVNSPMLQAWLAANPVGIEDGLRHDKWLAMMLPRVKLLRELMADTGSFWMTLDDNEMHRARVLLDEVFGPDNLITQIVWRSSDNSNNDSKGFSTDKNYLIGYSKSLGWAVSRITPSEDQGKHFKNPDGDPKGAWFDGNPVDSPNYRENLIYNIVSPQGNAISPPKNGWRWQRQTLEQKIASGEIRFSDDGKRIIRRTYQNERTGVPPSDLWIDLERYGHNRNAKFELRNIMGEEGEFQTPKPTKLMNAILSIAASKSDAVVLDPFAGSGTTGHAVLSANARDGGTRRFVLIENEGDANRPSFADTLTAERIRRAINGYVFTGTQRTELLREPVTWTTLRKADVLLDRVAVIENLEGAAYDSVEKAVKGGFLTVTGVKRIEERTLGLGGTFTFCTLGLAINLGALLAGDNLPSFEMLGAGLFHAATHAPFDPTAAELPTNTEGPSVGGLGYLGETETLHVWMLYRPDKSWLSSPAAALTLALAKQVVKRRPAGKRHLIFAATRFVPQRVLDEGKIQVEFAPLPFGRDRPVDPPAAAVPVPDPAPASAALPASS